MSREVAKSQPAKAEKCVEHTDNVLKKAFDYLTSANKDVMFFLKQESDHLYEMSMRDDITPDNITEIVKSKTELTRQALVAYGISHLSSAILISGAVLGSVGIIRMCRQV